MRVLIATIFSYPPRGGLGVYMEHLAKGLKQQGHQVDILGRYNDHYYITRENRRIPMKIKKKGTNGLSSFVSNGMGSKLLQAHIEKMQENTMNFLDAIQSLDLKQYEVIHAQDIISARVLKHFKPSLVPLVITVHGCVTAEYYYYGLISPETAGWKLISAFESDVIRQCDRIIVPSNWLLEIYKKCGIPTGNMKVIHNGIDIPSFQAQMNQKTDLKSPSNEKIIICTGRLVESKGQHCLLDALAKLKKQRKGWVCWIAGNGKTERALKKQHEQLKLGESVKFLGRREDIPALLKQTHIFVIPSIQDNYPYSLAEAQIAGKSIVASRVGGITEMVMDEKTGLLFPPGDSNELCNQLKKLLDHPDLQQRLSRETKEWGRKYLSLDHMMRQVLEVYHEVLKTS
ncbi:glycosyltransferase family 4 protein [Paenibacillus abyssi]|uniref:Glycosyl transferase family 1 n=1 Tax=Paenibacillus abyssi TaxID=1340531 RepID=A0A917FYC8_9BACL|nr:glycosyltransferase family 4 protein [Paenibacillus abyssi]GGG14068.1 hypothetical protein GCM10010916_33710 [Paenibacillus abyssi]